MGDVIVLPVVRIERHTEDGGKARITHRRQRLGLNEPFRGEDDLVQDHADPELPSDSEPSVA